MEKKIIKLNGIKKVKEIICEYNLDLIQKTLNRLIELGAPNEVVNNYEKQINKIKKYSINGKKEFGYLLESETFMYEIEEVENTYFKGKKKTLWFKFYTTQGIVYYDLYLNKVSNTVWDFRYRKSK